jgi:phosphoribosyl-dephospho-CoA transferase
MSRSSLHRHQLAWLGAAGWNEIRARDWDATAKDCLAHWAARRLPLVVTRQPAAANDAEGIAMGLPAPGRWGRRRLALSVPRSHVLYFDEFPRAEEIERHLPRAVRRDWRSLCRALQGCGATARVHGSYGWQHLSGLDHVREGSDVDLWISVSDGQQADTVVSLLQTFARPRLDGELVFERDQAIAWREWRAWRAGSTPALLVKHIGGARLSRDPWAAEAMA